jgi:hypothetical protein
MKQFLVLLVLSISLTGGKPNDPTKHIYEPERLKIIKDTETVCGTVVYIRSEEDGDYHIRLKMNPCSVSLSHKNYTKQDSCIVLEIICEHKSIISNCKCDDYINKIKVPKIGDKIQAIGQLVFDKRHKWIEIHPVFKINYLNE